MELKPGTVVWVETPRSDGKGFKVHPAIVIEDDGDMIHVVAGSSQKATDGALRCGEFLVKEQGEREAMGLDGSKEATRFSWTRGNYVWVDKKLVKYVIGTTPNNVLGRALKAGLAAGAIKM